MAEDRYLPRQQALAASTQYDKRLLTPVALERARPFMDRASRRTVNQVTMKETMKAVREIKNIARKKFPSTKSTGDRIARAREGDIKWTSSSSVEAPTGSPPVLLRRVGSLGSLEVTVSVVASGRGTPSPLLQMWIAGAEIESESSVTIDGISGLAAAAHARRGWELWERSSR